MQSQTEEVDLGNIELDRESTSKLVGETKDQQIARLQDRLERARRGSSRT